MSDFSAELPPLADPARIATLARSLKTRLKEGRRQPEGLRAAAIKARLQAMKLAPIPADPRHAVERAREAARLAKEAGDGVSDGDPQAGAEARAQAAEARKLAAAVVARARKGLRPGSPEDVALERLQSALGGGESVDLSV